MVISNELNTQFDKNLIDLMLTFFKDYNFSIAFSAPGNTTLTITDAKENQIPVPVSAVTQGRRVSLSMDITDFLLKPDGLGLVFNW